MGGMGVQPAPGAGVDPGSAGLGVHSWPKQGRQERGEDLLSSAGNRGEAFARTVASGKNVMRRTCTLSLGNLPSALQGLLTTSPEPLPLASLAPQKTPHCAVPSATSCSGPEAEAAATVLLRSPGVSSALELPYVAVPAPPWLFPLNAAMKSLSYQSSQGMFFCGDLGGQEQGDCLRMSGRLTRAVDSPACQRMHHSWSLVADTWRMLCKRLPRLAARD